jgi:carboxypeptidase PM20D1
LLESRGIRPWFVMDEGGALGDSLVPGVPGLVAVVGVAEKGYLSLRLTAHGEGGHSSMPHRETAVSILADAVSKVQHTPLPSHLNDATMAMFNTIGPLMPFQRQVVMANLWLFEPVLTRMLSKMPSGNAMVRTTTAATMMSAGIKDNVVPSTATAVVNFRLQPGDSVAWVIARVKAIVGDDRVAIEALSGGGREATGVSPSDADGFKIIAQTIREVFPGAHVSPYLVMAGTDARNFYRISPNVYRFVPIVAKGETLSLIHGTNERVSVENYLMAVRFYRRLIEVASR